MKPKPFSIFHFAHVPASRVTSRALDASYAAAHDGFEASTGAAAAADHHAQLLSRRWPEKPATSYASSSFS